MLEAKLKATQGKLTKSIANGASEMQLAKEDAKAKLDAFKKQYVTSTLPPAPVVPDSP